LLIADTSPKKIGFKLNIGYDTVKYHQKNLYEKYSVYGIKEFIEKYLLENSAETREVLAHKPLSTPFVLTFNESTPYGWVYKFEPDVFQDKDNNSDE